MKVRTYKNDQYMAVWLFIGAICIQFGCNYGERKGLYAYKTPASAWTGIFGL